MSLRDEFEAAGAEVIEEPHGVHVAPLSTAALGRVVAVARAHQQRISVRGSGDSPVGAGPVLVDLGARLDHVGAVDGETGVVRAEAGCSVAALETAARRAGCTLGPLLPSVRAGSLGAWLAGPTRGERGVAGSRRETAALSIAAVLADGRIAEGREAPRSACGPGLDALSLGGCGRLTVIAAAWVRLFPASAPYTLEWRSARPIDDLERLCGAGLAPARARVAGDRLACSWESCALDRERAKELLGLNPPDAARASPDWLRSSPGADAVEIDGRWPALHACAAFELQLVGLHAGGAFAVVSEAGATLARAEGAMVIAPRRLRDAPRAWERSGAWKRLVTALGVEEPR
jgi:FAD/FMN-containing dehydrogenase